MDHDIVRNLMFAGGYVKCLSWSPCYISDADVQEDQPSFLAVSTFRSAADRPKYSDLMQSGPGVIQIWRCSGLSLCKRYALGSLWIETHFKRGSRRAILYAQPHYQSVDWNSTPELRPYLFLAHDWGTLMDMQWLPLPVKMAGRQDRRCRLPPDLTYSRHPDEVAKAVASMLGHLIIACTDGLVRILPIPQTAALDALALKYANHVDRDRKFEPSSSRSFLPLFTFKPDSVLLLAPATRKFSHDLTGTVFSRSLQLEYCGLVVNSIYVYRSFLTLLEAQCLSRHWRKLTVRWCFNCKSRLCQ
ncbi:unnamed protein product [Schistocephalus solidus]|uniref:Mediator of RNA polymerase II transcription subunit 13 n=1 Tax=Schistocephalus solidus TaxID=70667 RepID=A0A183TN90_SCHSO|nr:unnamed protein product [Schistocephalus solidus]